MKQQTLAMAAEQTFENYRKLTRRDEFLKTMEAIVPWSALCEVIEPHYPKAGNGRPPIGLERMLRIHFIQHGFNLADLSCEQALYDSASLRRFAGIHSKAAKAKDFTHQRVKRKGEIDEVAKAKNRTKSSIRARVEHVFGVVKRLWGFGKVRYRGLAKNATRAFTALALANIFLARKMWMAQVRP